jgi:hypothetical protein
MPDDAVISLGLIQRLVAVGYYLLLSGLYLGQYPSNQLGPNERGMYIFAVREEVKEVKE